MTHRDPMSAWPPPVPYGWDPQRSQRFIRVNLMPPPPEGDERWVRAMKRASQRGIAFRLTEKECIEILSRPCYLCGDGAKVGMDRVDNTVGYVPGNVSPCCKHCNLAKRDSTLDDFVDRCHRISLRHARSSIVTR